MTTIEACLSELMTTDFQPALLNNELLQQQMVEPAVKTAVIHQLHVAIASAAVAGARATVVADLVTSEEGVDF